MILWTFGDSFSCSLTLDHKWIKNYTDFKGYQPKIYSELISDELGIELRNYAKTGDSNYGIFEEFLKHVEDIKQDDVVIIQFSSVYRFRLVNKNDEFESIAGHWNDQYKNFNESPLTIQEIGINRLSKKYLTEIDNWIKIVKLLLPNNKILFWSPFEETTGNVNMLPFYQLTNITEETNNMVNDHHYGEIGHKHMADYIVLKLENKKNII